MPILKKSLKVITISMAKQVKTGQKNLFLQNLFLFHKMRAILIYSY